MRQLPWFLCTVAPGPHPLTLLVLWFSPHFGVDPNFKITLWTSCCLGLAFFDVTQKLFRKTPSGIQLAWICRTFSRHSFSIIFQEIHQTSPLPRFFPCQKRFKKWSKLQFLNCFMGHSYTLNRLPDGYAKSCKVTPKYTKITAKWARKTMDHAFAIAKNTPHRLTCQNASKCDRFCCSRSCIALEKCADIT